jgi:glycerol-3-phosphate acyltransferase PlsY
MIMPALSVNLSELIFWTGLSYFIGSIPFGLLLAKAMGLGNLRNIGSGNIGATNVLRTGNKKAAALTLALDAAKGAFAVALALSYSGEAIAQIAAISALLGHCYPVWLRFQGKIFAVTFNNALGCLVFKAANYAIFNENLADAGFTLLGINQMGVF